MEPIRVRNPQGDEMTFTDPDHLGRAIAEGAITPEWAVYESASGQWTRVAGPDQGAAPPPSRGGVRRSREVVLIYPPAEAMMPRNSAPETTTDPLDLVSILTPEEIDRVLGRRPRASPPEAAAEPDGPDAYPESSSPPDLAMM